MRQFYLATDSASPPRAGDVVTLDADESRHLRTVLRGGRDRELVLVDGRGRRMTARPRDGAGPVRLEILTVARVDEEAAPPRLVLGCAVVKGRRFEWVLEKAVELGAHRIVPLRTERGVVAARPGKQSRWQSLLVAALKQSGRALLPELAATVQLADLLDEARSGMTLFGAVPGETEAGPWTDLLAPAPRPLPATLTLLVGPEGGWTPAERGLMRESGAHAVGLGPHVLRTETAAAAGLAALQALRQAWNTAGEA